MASKWYSVGNLVLPRRIFYLIREMGWNLVAPSYAMTQPILDFKVSNGSLGYGECCIRVWVRMAQGWLGYRWIRSGVEFCRNRPSFWRNFCENDTFLDLTVTSVEQQKIISQRKNSPYKKRYIHEFFVKKVGDNFRNFHTVAAVVSPMVHYAPEIFKMWS